jgi:hypothetical protein
MHFKTCRKASSSDDCERITGKPEVMDILEEGATR